MQPTRLFDIMDRQAQEHPLPDALAAKEGTTWRLYSSREVVDTTRDYALGWLQLGIRKGERVALISGNRPEWVMSDLALQQLGVATVPLYPTATATDFAYILKHSGARFLLVSNHSIYNKIQEMRAQLPKLQEIYTFDQIPGAKHWSEIVNAGKVASASQKTELEAARAAVTPQDLASIIYTSGTTGTPKGVMLSHHNFVTNVYTVLKVLDMTHLRRALSFLPLSHVFERTVSYVYQANNIAIYFAESTDTIVKNLPEVRPQVFVTVPRLLEKVYEGIVAKGRTLTGIKRRLFDWSLELGLEYDPNAPLGPVAALKLAIARKLVFSKWQAALGGELEMVFVGGSALQPRLCRIFWLPASRWWRATASLKPRPSSR